MKAGKWRHFSLKTGIFLICLIVLFSITMYLSDGPSEPRRNTDPLLVTEEEKTTEAEDPDTEDSGLTFSLNMNAEDLMMGSSDPEAASENAYGDITSMLPSELSLPASSEEYSALTAIQMLYLCAASGPEDFQSLMEEYGFTVLTQKNFDKADDDPGFTSAFTIGKGPVEVDGESRTAFLVTVRGTNAGEWLSNFDFAPSHNEDTAFSENFLFSAEDIFDTLLPYLQEEPEALILLSGHSRGAAAANLTAVLLDEYTSSANVYAYTFATPNTIKKGKLGRKYRNIFNIINPCDAVTKVPLSDWGFARAGVDILLPGDDEKIRKVENAVATLYETAPDIEGYYNDRYALDGPGLSEDGLTSFDMMLTLCQPLTTYKLTGSEEESDDSNSLSITGIVSEDSHFAPLMDLVEEALSDNGSIATAVMMEHMPTTYAEPLIEEASKIIQEQQIAAYTQIMTAASEQAALLTPEEIQVMLQLSDEEMMTVSQTGLTPEQQNQLVMAIAGPMLEAAGLSLSEGP